MVTIDVREFEEHPAEVVRQVKSGETVQLVEDGRTVATITPVQHPYSEEQAKAFLQASAAITTALELQVRQNLGLAIPATPFDGRRSDGAGGNPH